MRQLETRSARRPADLPRRQWSDPLQVVQLVLPLVDSQPVALQVKTKVGHCLLVHSGLAWFPLGYLVRSRDQLAHRSVLQPGHQVLSRPGHQLELQTLP